MALSTKLGSFFSDISTPEIRQAAQDYRLRALIQPWGWHAWTYLSDATATGVVQFFDTALGYKNGYVSQGASGVATQSGQWKIQELSLIHI